MRINNQQLNKLTEAVISKIKKSDLGPDWDSERILNKKERNKDMYIKTNNGFKQIERKSGQTKVYFLTKIQAERANSIVEKINKLQSDLNEILK